MPYDGKEHGTGRSWFADAFVFEQLLHRDGMISDLEHAGGPGDEGGGPGRVQCGGTGPIGLWAGPGRVGAVFHGREAGSVRGRAGRTRPNRGQQRRKAVQNTAGAQRAVKIRGAVKMPQMRGPVRYKAERHATRC